MIEATKKTHWIALGLASLVVGSFVLGPVFGLLAALALGLLLLMGTLTAEVVAVWLALQMPLLLQGVGADLQGSTAGGVPVLTMLNVTFVGAVALAWARAPGNRGVSGPPGARVYTAYLALCVLSAVAIGTPSIADALQRLVSLSIPLVFAAYVSRSVHARPQTGALMAHAMLASMELAVLSAIVGDWQVLSSQGKLMHGGVLGHPASLGYYCACFIPVAVGYLQSGSARRSDGALQLHSYVAVGLGLVGLLVAGSRGAWLAFLLAAACVGTLYNRRLGLAALLVVLGVWFSPALIGRVDLSVRQFAAGDAAGGSGRLEIWAVTWELVQQSGWIGHGFNSYFQTTRNLFAGTLTESFAHNDYLYAWFELGILGPVLLACTSIAWFFRGVSIARKRDPASVSVAGAIIAVAVVLMVGRFFDNLLFMTSLQTHAFAAVAALAATSGCAGTGSAQAPHVEAV